MKLFLHACCGPCAAYPVKFFQDKEIDFSVYYFNPNIHPIEEHLRRGEALKLLSYINNFELIYSTAYNQGQWKNFKGESLQRCKMCYEIRLEETARQAKFRGFDAFSTTLLISPYQDHDLIKSLAIGIAKKLEIEFYYEDFRPKFREGQLIARQSELYMQRYCGCVNSLQGNGR